MRDYYKNPLSKGEDIPEEELYDLFINQNYSRTKLQKYFNVGRTKIATSLKKYGIKKSAEKKVESYKLSCLEKYGSTHPRKNKEKNQQISQKQKNTNMQRYNVEYASQCPQIKEKILNTWLNNYGTTKIKTVPEIKKKERENCLKKYGVEHSSQAESVKEKHRKTNLEKYGVSNYFKTEEFKKKSKQTCLNKYGTEFASQNEEIKNKTKETNLERYGVEWTLQNEEIREKAKETLVEKYGVDNYAKSEDFVEKTKITCREKYGYDFASQSPEFREKVAQTNLERYGAVCTLSTLEGIKKKKETWLKNLGVDHPSKNPEVVKKQWNTRKKNGTASSSKAEKYIKDKLLEKFEIVETNYDEDVRYPYHCDFYIPQLDLFIEYQGFEGHGDHPFNPESLDDLYILDKWLTKAEEKQLDKRNKYLGYIEVWTIKDPEKRKIAKDNNLNFLEFFDLKQFDKWFEQLSNIINK